MIENEDIKPKENPKIEEEKKENSKNEEEKKENIQKVEEEKEKQEETTIKTRVKNLFTKLAKSCENLTQKDTEIILKSITFTKTALPILYSNLILIEDMKFENSNYFLHSNGFLSKKITLSSNIHDKNFDISECAFRIYPRTYNVNKYRVLDYINKNNKLDVEDINSKLSAEIFNNLDIVQNKFGEPVRYGDIIMLMHENSHMFIKYISSTKNLSFSNHDGDATLFSVEPATEIMLNDNQILKSGQPIRLKVAGFNYASQNLFFGLRVPYPSNYQEDIINDLEKSLEKESSDENSKDDDVSEDKQGSFEQEPKFDKKNKKYFIKPDLVVEENSTMSWRFVLYNAFTTNENLISYGDFIQINYCDKNAIIGVAKNEDENLNLENSNNVISGIKSVKSESVIDNTEKSDEKSNFNDSIDLAEKIIDLDLDKEISLSEIEDEDDEINYNKNKDYDFYLRDLANFNITNQDVDSIWILESIYPKMKSQSFIRFFEDNKLDTYRMIFRIRHYKTNKILSIAEIDNKQTELLLGHMYKQGYMKGAGDNQGKNYKFVLLDDSDCNVMDKDYMLKSEYKYSLFGFKKTNKSKSIDLTKPLINDFVKLYHVQSQSYIKIITKDNIKTKFTVDNIVNCVLILIKYPDEKEVIRIERIHYNLEWKMKLSQNLYKLAKISINNIDKYKNNITSNVLNKVKYLLNKLTKFIMNKFINKYDDRYGFSKVVENRQLLISDYKFEYLFLRKFIYNYWILDKSGTPSMEKLKTITDILIQISQNNDKNFLTDKKQKIMYTMFRYTEAIFNFMVVYCKENSVIKNILYQYLPIFFYFINLSNSCVDALIEIFTNEESILYSIIKDCEEKQEFQSALSLIFKEYFSDYNKSNKEPKFELINTDINNINTTKTFSPYIRKPNNNLFNLFDLIIECIKISTYANISTNERILKNFNTSFNIINNNPNKKVISFVPREKYFELLLKLVHIDDKGNILENQTYLIQKFLNKNPSITNNYLKDPAFECKDDYPPCFKKLFYELAVNIKDNSIKNFLCHRGNNNEIIIFNKQNFSQFIENPQRIAPSDLNTLTFMIQNDLISEISRKQIKTIFEDQKIRYPDNKRLNYAKTDEIDNACDIIYFMKKMIELDLIKVKKETSFLEILIGFFKSKHDLFAEWKDYITIQGNMNKTERIIFERITKTEHEKYITISEAWHRIYQVFRKELIRRIEDKYVDPKSKKVKVTKTVKTINTINNNINTVNNINNVNNNNIQTTNQDPNINTAMNATSQEQLLNKSNKQLPAITNEEQKTNNENNNLDENINTNSKKNQDTPLVENNNENNENIENNLNNNDKNESGNLIKKDITEGKFNELPLNEGVSTKFIPIGEKIEEEIQTYELMTKENVKSTNQIKMMKNIADLFKILIRKNVRALNMKFNKFYYSRKEGQEFNPKKSNFNLNLNINIKININSFNFIEEGKKLSRNDLLFKDFIDSCIPELDSGVKFVSKKMKEYYMAEPNKYYNKNVAEQEGFIYLNNLFEDFIPNVIIGFCTSEEEKEQEILIDLLYKYFHQRKSFFKDVKRFNENILENKENNDNVENDNIDNEEFIEGQEVEKAINIKKLNTKENKEIKILFNNMFQNYEKMKNHYTDESNQLPKIEFFLNELNFNLLEVFKGIFENCRTQLNKPDVRNQENNIYNVKEIGEILEKLKILSDVTRNDNALYDTQFFVKNLSIYSKILKFIRQNKHDVFLTNISNALGSHGELYTKLFISLFNDFIFKSKKIINSLGKFFFFGGDLFEMAQNKGLIINQKTSIKNKIFTVLILILILSSLVFPKNLKTLSFYYNILTEYDEALKMDSYSRFLILLFIVDIQYSNFSVDYFFIFSKCRSFNENENFGTMNPEIGINGAKYPLCFSKLYLDVIYKVLKFVIYKNQMISEIYLDETIVDVFFYLLKKIDTRSGYDFSKKESMENERIDTKEKIGILLKLVKIINKMGNVEQLNKIILLKIDPKNPDNLDLTLNKKESKKNSIFGDIITNSIGSDKKENNKKNENDDRENPSALDNYFISPEKLLQIFISNLCGLFNESTNGKNNRKELYNVKNIFEIYKYALYYICFIKMDYFFKAEFSIERLTLKQFIEYIIYGYYAEEEIKENFTNEEFKSFFNAFPELNEYIKRNGNQLFELEQLLYSSLFMLLNQVTIIKFLDFCHKEIKHVRFVQKSMADNYKAIYKDFFSMGKYNIKEVKEYEEEEEEEDDDDKKKDDEDDKIEDELISNKENIYQTNKIMTKIGHRTTNSRQVNFYVLSELKEILEYSLIMDFSSIQDIQNENIKIQKNKNINEKKSENNEMKKHPSMISNNKNNLGMIVHMVNNESGNEEERLWEHSGDLNKMIYVIRKEVSRRTKAGNKTALFKFKSMLNEKKKELIKYEKNEASSIIFYILSFLDESNKQLEQKIDQKTDHIFNQFLSKVVEFINLSINNSHEMSRKRIKHITYLIYIIKKILSFYEKCEETSLIDSLRKRTLREMQITIEKTGIVKTCLQLITKYNCDKTENLVNNIFKLFCKVLKSGNSNSQEAFYNYFNIKNDYESVFCFMTETINKKIQYIISNKFLILKNKKENLQIHDQLLLEEKGSEIDENILEFLQLLCENHNRKLQLYLHRQNNFRRDYDLVTDTQHYLNILFNYFEPFLFESLCKCFDLLIEMIQGPCYETQQVLINSKLLVTINDLNRYYLMSESETLKLKFPEVEAFKNNYFTSNNQHQDSDEDLQDIISFKNNFYKMTTQEISLLTFKASVLLQALVDSRNKFDPLYGTMKNIITNDILEKIYTKVYYEHLSTVAKTNELRDYTIRLTDFNRSGDIEEYIAENSHKNRRTNQKKKCKAEDYLILETGFYMYFLWRYYADYESTFNNKFEIIEKDNMAVGWFKTSIFGEFFYFIIDFLFAILTTICLFIGLIIQFISIGKIHKYNLIRNIRDFIFPIKYNDAYAVKFYKDITKSIEVLKEENVYIIYFYLLPFCKGLNRFERQKFLEDMDRTNTQSKLMDVMRYSDEIKYELEKDYEIKELFKKLSILGLVFTSVEFWKDLSLLISIILNLSNFFASYYDQTSRTLCLEQNECFEIKQWTETHTLFGLSVKKYESIINGLSFFQCGLNCVIYVEYMLRKGPAIYALAKEESFRLNLTGCKKSLYVFFKTVWIIITSFDILYYTGAVVFGFLGVYESDFFFSYLLLEIITRFKTLQNVLVAIKNPYKELLLIFILWIILIYYCSIIAYTFFRDDFTHEKDCNSLLRCVATIFHQNNRMDNGIAGYLKSRYDEKKKNPFTGRFFYDELSNLILKILIVSMISGIIIDNFAALRESETEMIYDMNNVCTICSFKKDKIIKIYKKYGRDYYTHTEVDHYIFNYIFYIIYLFKKTKTELNGMETYIYESAFVQKDITWFPIKKLYIAKPDELEFDSDEEGDDDESED